ncbi:hypothetical protein [Gordonia effusa]|uniref:hypothetical protein n=1 Tax=Gordonia effusa TaxID=263908 RepID=UPI0002EA3E3F|nr:hypothetical protein [Gordonia effusa]
MTHPGLSQTYSKTRLANSAGLAQRLTPPTGQWKMILETNDDEHHLMFDINT